MSKRLHALLNLCGELDMSGVLLSSPENMRYFTGFTGEGWIFVSLDAKTIFTDFRYTEQAALETKGFDILDATDGERMRALGDALARVSSVGIEDESLTYSAYRRIEQSTSTTLKPLAGVLAMLRSVKDEEELALMQQAASIAERALEDLLGIIKPGMTEQGIAAELEYRMRRFGAEGPSFDTIAASGPNSSKPHAVPSQRKLQDGDFLTLDFGCKVGWYCCDMTRTFAIGRITDEMKQVYEVTLEAHMRALNALEPGKTGKDVDAVARTYISQMGYGEYFGHGLGHGVGLEIHEEPRLTPRDAGQNILKPGQVVTIEPGIYVPGMGGVRIEDMCYLTGEGYSNFNTFSKALTVI